VEFRGERKTFMVATDKKKGTGASLPLWPIRETKKRGKKKQDCGRGKRGEVFPTGNIGKQEKRGRILTPFPKKRKRKRKKKNRP